MSDHIIVRNLSKSYRQGNGDFWSVLNDVSFEIAPGEILCLLGPSGSGKTTLLNILTGLDDKYEGSVELLPGRDNGACIGYMFQSDSLLPWRTVEQNVMLGLEIRGITDKEFRHAAQELLREFGLGKFSRSYPSQLSGGMKQKVALARTLAIRPSFLVLDEPLSHLDVVSRGRLAKIIRSYVINCKASSIIVSHSIEDAIAIGSRILLLGGRPARIRADYGVPDMDGGQPTTAKYKSAGELFARISESFGVLSIE